MKTLVICHVSETGLRRTIRRKLENYGFALAHGLFECELDDGELNELRHFLSELPYKRSDCVRIYRLCAACEKKSLSFGECVVAPVQPEWIIF